MLTEDTQNAIYQQLGEIIKEARTKAEIKQELLADFLDLSRVSISNIEKGKQRIQFHTLLELVKYLRINPSHLLEPLTAIITDTVSPEQEKRILEGLRTPKFPSSSETPPENAEKVKEFVNFLKSKKDQKPL